MTIRAKHYQNAAVLHHFCTDPFDPFEPAELLSNAIKGQHAHGANPEV